MAPASLAGISYGTHIRTVWTADEARRGEQEALRVRDEALALLKDKESEGGQEADFMGKIVALEQAVAAERCAQPGLHLQLKA
jgi:hypothetical protein